MTKTKEITKLAFIIAIAIIFRVYVRLFPNVQLLSPIVILYTLRKKYVESLIISTLVLIISGVFISFGIWVVFQIISYSIVVLFVFIINKLFFDFKFKEYIILFSSGLVYGLIITFIQCLFLTGINTFFVFYITSIPFDVYHGIGNVLTYHLILKKVIKIKKFD